MNIGEASVTVKSQSMHCGERVCAKYPYYRPIQLQKKDARFNLVQAAHIAIGFTYAERIFSRRVHPNLKLHFCKALTDGGSELFPDLSVDPGSAKELQEPLRAFAAKAKDICERGENVAPILHAYSPALGNLLSTIAQSRTQKREPGGGSIREERKATAADHLSQVETSCEALSAILHCRIKIMKETERGEVTCSSYGRRTLVPTEVVLYLVPISEVQPGFVASLHKKEYGEECKAIVGTEQVEELVRSKKLEREMRRKIVEHNLNVLEECKKAEVLSADHEQLSTLKRDLTASAEDLRKEMRREKLERLEDMVAPSKQGLCECCDENARGEKNVGEVSNSCGHGLCRSCITEKLMRARDKKWELARLKCHCMSVLDPRTLETGNEELFRKIVEERKCAFCKSDKKKDGVIGNDCGHWFCRACVSKQLLKLFAYSSESGCHLFCVCGHPISELLLTNVAKEYVRLNSIKCYNCKYGINCMGIGETVAPNCQHSYCRNCIDFMMKRMEEDEFKADDMECNCGKEFGEEFFMKNCYRLSSLDKLKCDHCGGEQEVVINQPCRCKFASNCLHTLASASTLVPCACKATYFSPLILQSFNPTFTSYCSLKQSTVKDKGGCGAQTPQPAVYVNPFCGCFYCASCIRSLVFKNDKNKLKYIACESKECKQKGSIILPLFAIMADIELIKEKEKSKEEKPVPLSFLMFGECSINDGEVCVRLSSFMNPNCKCMYCRPCLIKLLKSRGPDKCHCPCKKTNIDPRLFKMLGPIGQP